jgi:hypothetical protein
MPKKKADKLKRKLAHKIVAALEEANHFQVHLHEDETAIACFFDDDRVGRDDIVAMLTIKL